MIGEVQGCHTRAEWLLLFLSRADIGVRCLSTPYTQVDVSNIVVPVSGEAEPLCLLLIRMLYLSYIATPFETWLGPKDCES